MRRWQYHLLPHAPIGVHTQHPQLNAAVRLASPAGNALPTGQIRVHRAQVARGYIRYSRPHRQHFHPQFVPQYARVAEERLPPAEGMQVGSANAHRADSHQRLTGARRCCRWQLSPFELARLGQ